MGGHQVQSIGSGDDGFDEDGYDESQRAEILEATRDGPSNGTILTDLSPDLGGEVEEPDEDDVTELEMSDSVLGEETVGEADGDDDSEDEAQDDFDADEVDEDTLDDGEDVALRP